MGKSTEEIEQQLIELEEEIADRLHLVYGSGSERRPRKDKPAAPPKPPQKGHGPRPQPELLVEEKVHVLDEADEVCPSCGDHLPAWEGQFEDSEEVDVVEIQYVRRKHRRQKYRCGCGHIETALGPEKSVDGGRYSLDFGVHVAVSKWADHLPLERQVKRMRRAGLKVDSQTLWDQVQGLARHLEPVLERLHGHLLSKEVVLVDETRWPVLGTKGRKTNNWFVWSLTSDDAVLYKIQNGRSNQQGEAILQNYKGLAVTTATWCTTRSRRRTVSCWPTAGVTPGVNSSRPRPALQTKQARSWTRSERCLGSRRRLM